MVKYVESVYNISSSLSSILIGLIVVPSAIIGTLTGGFLIRYYKLNKYKIIKYLLICCLFGLFGLIIIIFLQCKSNININETNECIKSCNCSPYIYEPVCYNNQINYISPCYAGCTSINGTVRLYFDFNLI